MSKNRMMDSYEELMRMESHGHEMEMSGLRSYGGMGSSQLGDEELEGFITSEDLVKMKKEERDQYVEDGDPSFDGVIEETFEFKRYSTKRVHKYTEQEMEEISRSCDDTIVHDYGDNDIYHISDEDREQLDQLYSISVKLSSLKSKYRKIDQYIIAMRIVFEAWDLLEQKCNHIHPRGEFFRMVSSGQISSPRIIMPKMHNIDRYDMGLISKYISNHDLDPADLVPKTQTAAWMDDDPFYCLGTDDDMDYETEADAMKRLLSPTEVKTILDFRENPDSCETVRIGTLDHKYVKGYGERAQQNGKRRRGKTKKKDEHLRENVAVMLHKLQDTQSGTSQYNSSVIVDLFERDESAEKLLMQQLYFDGSWTDDNEVKLLELVTDQVIRANTTGTSSQYSGTRTMEQIAESEFYNTLDAAGVSSLEIRRMLGASQEALQRKNIEEQRKRSRKTEAKAVARIRALNDNPKFKKEIARVEEAIAKAEY